MASDLLICIICKLDIIGETMYCSACGAPYHKNHLDISSENEKCCPACGEVFSHSLKMKLNSNTSQNLENNKIIKKHIVEKEMETPKYGDPGFWGSSNVLKLRSTDTSMKKSIPRPLSFYDYLRFLFKNIKLQAILKYWKNQKYILKTYWTRPLKITNLHSPLRPKSYSLNCNRFSEISKAVNLF